VRSFSLLLCEAAAERKSRRKALSTIQSPLFILKFEGFSRNRREPTFERSERKKEKTSRAEQPEELLRSTGVLTPSHPRRSFPIESIEKYNHNTSRFVFTLPDGQSSGLTVASALVCKAANEGECLNDKGKPVIRPYTPVTAPDVEGKLVRLSSPSFPGALSRSSTVAVAGVDDWLLGRVN
jgi:hypothetical protein